MKNFVIQYGKDNHFLENAHFISSIDIARRVATTTTVISEALRLTKVEAEAFIIDHIADPKTVSITDDPKTKEPKELTICLVDQSLKTRQKNPPKKFIIKQLLKMAKSNELSVRQADYTYWHDLALTNLSNVGKIGTHHYEEQESTVAQIKVSRGSKYRTFEEEIQICLDFGIDQFDVFDHELSRYETRQLCKEGARWLIYGRYDVLHNCNSLEEAFKIIQSKYYYE